MGSIPTLGSTKHQVDDHLEQRGREARSIESNRGIARKVAADRLGGKMIQDLGPKDFDDFDVRLRSNGLSPGSIKRYHSVLGGAFQQAMKWGWTNRNVVRLATPPAVPRQPRCVQTPRRHRRATGRDLRTAMVVGRPRPRVLWIRHSVARLLRTKLEPDGYVIADLATDPTGLTPIPPDRLTRAFERLTARVPGAGDIRLHDLRHWYASTQLDAGESLPAVAARIGDHVETLARVYAHRGHRGDHDAADSLGALIDNPD